MNVNINTQKNFSYNDSDILDVHYTESDLCSHNDNKFIPVCFLSKGQLTIVGSIKLFFYSFYINIFNIRTIINYSRFCDIFNSISLEDKYLYHLTYKRIDTQYYISAGKLYYHNKEHQEEPIPLMLMCVNTENLFEVQRGVNTNTKTFTILVNNDLVNKEKHKILYRNIKKYILDYYGQEIDILFTNNINSLCLNPVKIEAPKFKTIPEMLAHNTSINETLKKAINNVRGN